jgi:hypothetical protein
VVSSLQIFYLRNYTKVWSGQLKGRELFGDLGIDGKVILKLFKNRVLGCGLNSSGSGKGPFVDSSEQNNKPSSSMKDILLIS